jgi:DNA-binding GntR family transcriptional regulator
MKRAAYPTDSPGPPEGRADRPGAGAEIHFLADAKSPPLPEFDAILVRTRREQVVQLLHDAIMSGQIKPGAQLVEMKLAARIGVSRGSVREAMRELVEQGLLVSKPYGGTFVATITETGMDEVFGLRKVLEQHAFRLVWEKRGETYRREFAVRHDALIATIGADDLAAEIKAEMHFHATPYEFCGNALLLEMWQMLAQRIRLAFMISQSVDRRRSFKAANERFLRTALGDDLDAMLAEVDRHITMGLRRVRRFLRMQGGAA